MKDTIVFFRLRRDLWFIIPTFAFVWNKDVLMIDICIMNLSFGVTKINNAQAHS